MFYTDAVFAMPETNLTESGEERKERRKRMKGTNRDKLDEERQRKTKKDTSNEQLIQ